MEGCQLFVKYYRNILCFLLDLELAAAIGKNLLERNKELDLLFHSTQDYAEEQVKKSEVSTVHMAY